MFFSRTTAFSFVLARTTRLPVVFSRTAQFSSDCRSTFLGFPTQKRPAKKLLVFEVVLELNLSVVNL